MSNSGSDFPPITGRVDVQVVLAGKPGLNVAEPHWDSLCDGV